MAKQFRHAAWLAALLLPAAAAAQDGQADQKEAEVDHWAIEEHDLAVAPVEAEQSAEATSGDLPERPAPAWPSEQLRNDWDVAQPFTFVGVDPSVSARFDTAVGDVGNATNVETRAELDLYLLEVGLPLLQSAGGDREQLATMDLDLRVPFSLGDAHKFAIIPGVSFPIDDDVEKTADTTNVRVQGLYGFGAGGFGVQVGGGVTDGPRNAGLLHIGEDLTETAGTFSGLVAIRPLPALQLRLEANGEIATVDGQADRLTLLPAAVFFPWSDPRLGLGLGVVVEDVEDGLDFDDPAFGGLVNLGINFI